MLFSHRPSNTKKASTPWHRLGGILSRRETRNNKKQTDSHPKRKAKTTEAIILPRYDDEDDRRVTTRGAWFNPWKWFSYLLFVSLAGGLIYLCWLMWSPRELRDIRGARMGDAMPARDVEQLLATIKPRAQTQSFTESELNYSLRRSCRMRQDGSLALIAHPTLLALKIHDGYGELIIARALGSEMYHTTSVFLRFSYHEDETGKHVKLHLDNGKNIASTFLHGGQIGELPIPERFIKMMLPRLEPILAIYPALTALVEQHDYLPIFVRPYEETEGRLLLVPPSAQLPFGHQAKFAHNPQT